MNNRNIMRVIETHLGGKELSQGAKRLHGEET